MCVFSLWNNNCLYFNSWNPIWQPKTRSSCSNTIRYSFTTSFKTHTFTFSLKHLSWFTSLPLTSQPFYIQEAWMEANELLSVKTTTKYSQNSKMWQETERQSQKMLKNDVIEESTSHYQSSVVMVKKTNDQYIFEVGYRKLTSITELISFSSTKLH